MNTTEPGPSETQYMIAINESLRAELEQAKAENLKLMAAFINKPDTASSDIFLPAIDVKKLLAPTIDLLKSLDQTDDECLSFKRNCIVKELARLEALTKQ